MKEELKDVLLDFQIAYNKVVDLMNEIEDKRFKERMELCLNDIGCDIYNFEEEIDLWEE